jgi:hypothetical protein
MEHYGKREDSQDTGAIGSLYHNTSIILDLDGKLTKTFTTNKGVRATRVLSFADPFQPT